MSSEKEFRNEVNLAEDECCIVFDFSCYYPYVETELFDFGFSMGLEDIKDFKLNHRFPNKHHFTLSRKYGRKVSKIGYPYVMKIEDQMPFTLALHIGFNGHVTTLQVPVVTKMTKEKPVCSLVFRFNYENSRFFLESCVRCEENASCSPDWRSHLWRSHEYEDNPPCCDLVKTWSQSHKLPGDNPQIVYDDIIEVPPSRIEDLLLTP